MADLKFEISKFNINFGFKDRQHIDLLKRQIENGYKLPIEVYEENGVYKVIDGGHAWVAYEELGREPKNVRVLTFRDNAEKIAYSRHKNINRLQQTPVTYTRSIFEELKLRLEVKTDEKVIQILRRYKNIKEQPERYEISANDKGNVTLIEDVFQNEPVTAISFTRNNIPYLDFPLWLAEMVDRGELSPAQASILNKKEVVEKIDEETRKRVALLLKGKSVRETEKAIQELINFEPEVFDVWNIAGCNPLFGMEEAEGRIPGQIIQNILHYYTREGDLVVDPMAGGGTTIDVCNLMSRKYLAYDIKPLREDIKQHDVTQGFPEETKGCDLIFLDPPYFKKKEKEYGENSVSALDKEGFLKFIEKLAKDCFQTVKVNGITTLLLSNYVDYESENSIFTAMAFDKFIKAGFTCVMAMQCPLSTEQYQGHDVKYAKENNKILIRSRDLFIFKKREIG